MADKIAVIKTGWSEDYRGSAVEAAHSHVVDFEDGHERFNFLPGPDGRFYGYTPPIGEQWSAPRPKELNGWTVFAVAKAPGRSGLHVVGWYENADFTGRYLPRPEYGISPSPMPRDSEGEQYVYTLTADRAVALPLEARDFTFAGTRLKRSPVYYLKGNGRKEDWRDQLADDLLALRDRHVPADPGTSPLPSRAGGICADSKRRKEVEDAAIECVTQAFPPPRYEIVDRQKDCCGFDLLVRDTGGDELHIEVKGTAMSRPHFLMSRNEYGYMQANPRPWRLAMVTDALGTPSLALYTAKEAAARFQWEEFTWRGISKD